MCWSEELCYMLWLRIYRFCGWDALRASNVQAPSPHTLRIVLWRFLDRATAEFHQQTLREPNRWRSWAAPLSKVRFVCTWWTRQGRMWSFARGENGAKFEVSAVCAKGRTPDSLHSQNKRAVGTMHNEISKSLQSCAYLWGILGVQFLAFLRALSG